MKETLKIKTLKAELKKYGWTKNDFKVAKYCAANDVKHWEKDLKIHLLQKIKDNN